MGGWGDKEIGRWGDGRVGDEVGEAEDDEAGEGGGEGAAKGGEEVDAPGERTKRDEQGPEFAHQDVEGIAGGVGNAEQRHGQLVFAGITANHAGSEGQGVEAEDGEEDEEEEEVGSKE
jgi:hypothetical protein